MEAAAKLAKLKKERQVIIKGIARDPVNSLAGRVTQPGVHVLVRVKSDPCRLESVEEPRIRVQLGGLQVNLTGRRVGKFVVLGLSEERKKRWVVRCECGMHEFRTAHAITNPNNYFDACRRCRDYEHINKSSRYFTRLASEGKSLTPAPAVEGR